VATLGRGAGRGSGGGAGADNSPLTSLSL
jgi:hypothetical protein